MSAFIRHNQTTRPFKAERVVQNKGRCLDCQVVYVNGVRCHESGCPSAWHDYARECKWCGSGFKPESQHQQCCEDCAKAYAS